MDFNFVHSGNIIANTHNKLVFKTFIIDRFYRNSILQFVDLISLANISILVFDESCHGYYIHGRSVHGSADVNMDELNHNLKKEEVRFRDIFTFKG